LVKPLDLTVSDLDPSKPIPLQAKWALQASDAPDVGGELSAEVLYDQAGQKVTLQNLAVDALLRGEQVPSGELTASLRGEAQADLEAQRYSVPKLTLQAAGVVANLVAEARQQGEQLTADAHLTVPSFNARDLMRRLQIEAPEMADPNALANVGLTAKIQYDGKGLVLQELQGQLDETHLTGHAAVPSFEPLAARFELALDRIDLDRYLAPEQEGKPAAGPAGGAGEAPAAETELPLELLRSLTLDGTVTIGQLTVKKLDATDIKARITARDGIIKAEPVAHLYQGRLRGLLTRDAAGEAPTIDMQQHLEGVQAGSLLEDLVGVARILGVANLDLAVGMQGLGLDDWLRTVSGKASFKLADGAISGINIAQAIQAAHAKLTNEPLPAADSQQQTPFNELQGSLQIDKGLVLNRDFNLASSQFKVAGDGQINLRTQAVDYTLMVDLLQPLLKGDNKLLAELQKQPIPVHISGSFRDLGISVDLQQALESAGKARLQAAEEKAKGRVQEEVQEKRQEVEQKLQEQVQDKLQNLLRPRR
jgi:AsmA protein